jgi:hypothetical protein
LTKNEGRMHNLCIIWMIKIELAQYRINSSFSKAILIFSWALILQNNSKPFVRDALLFKLDPFEYTIRQDENGLKKIRGLIL